MSQQFYEKALPSQGVYCATGIDKNGKATNRFAETLSDLISHIEYFNNTQQNSFVALSSFGNYSRMATNAIYSKSFFIDLDVDPANPKKYNSKEEALASLSDFLQITKLPPPVRVDTGGGYHAYWFFDRDVPIDEWLPYAKKFKEFCLDYMKIDPAPTADAARVMRCPNTYNFKYAEPRPTELLDEEFREYSFDKFKEFLGPIEEATDIFASIAKGLDTDTAALAQLTKYDNYEHNFSNLVVKSFQDQGCAQIRYIIENSKTLTEPVWRAGLSVAVRCVDANEAIHKMSKNYDGYSPEFTEQKAEQTKKATGPYECTTFNNLNPGVCDGCPHRGRIRTPIELAREFKPALSLEEVGEENAIRDDANSEEVPLFPTFLKPYVRGREGGVYYLQKGKVDEDGDKEPDTLIRLVTNDFFPVKRMHSPTEGESLLMRYILPKDPMKEFVFPVKYAYAFDKMKELLAFNGVNFSPNLTKYVSEYIIKWDEYMQVQKAAEIMRMQMGWTETFDGFVYGTVEILPDGSERPSATTSLIKNVSKYTKKSGSYDVWKKSASYFNREGMELHALGLLAGFGSPLMAFSNVAGCTISYVSPESGVGKTGSMFAAASVFCDPYHVSTSEGNATDNALLNRYLSLKNIAFCIDEAGGINSEYLSKLLHRVSQGRPKLRLQASIDAERELNASAALIAVLTSNQSLVDKLTSLKGTPDGEMARVIEFQLKKPQFFVDEPGVSVEIVQPLRSNFGHAGPEFIRYIFKIGFDRVKEIIGKWVARFKLAYGDDTAYRFYEATIASCFAGGEIANEAGIINLDLDRIFNEVIAVMIKDRKSVFKLNSMDYKELIGKFYNQYHSGFLVFNQDQVVSAPTHNAIVGRIEQHTGMYYISKEAMKKYLSAMGTQVNTSNAEEAWQKSGVLTSIEKCRLTTGWKGIRLNGVSCYVFKMEMPENIIINEPPKVN